jgi:hypothetical protein
MSLCHAHWQQSGLAMYYILVVGLTVATLITGAIVGSELVQEPGPSRITVIYKNQIQPTIAELETRTVKTEKGSIVNGDEAIVIPRRSQWI